MCGDLSTGPHAGSLFSGLKPPLFTLGSFHIKLVHHTFFNWQVFVRHETGLASLEFVLVAMSHTCIITPPCEWICRIHSQKQVLQGQSKYVRLILIDVDRLSCTKVLSMHTSTAWLEKDTFHQINTACSQNCITVKLGLNRRHLYLFTFYLFYMHVCTCLVPGAELRLSSNYRQFCPFFPLTQ